jgi:hypothetical protein|tara:strand:+ start:729 stop:989 length:261 start_codon:yes stop_codon:yes gene_type:complete
MEYEQKDNEGAAFAAKEKKEDWHDDWSGKIMVAGSMYWIGWNDRVSASGKDWKRIKVRPMDETFAPQAPSNNSTAPIATKGNDIPF